MRRYPHQHATAQPDIYLYADADQHADQYAHADKYSDRNIDVDPYIHTDRDADADSRPVADTNQHADADRDNMSADRRIRAVVSCPEGKHSRGRQQDVRQSSSDQLWYTDL